MDPLSALLDAGELTDDHRVSAPWSVVPAPTSGVVIVAVSEGEAWCHREDGDPQHLEAGDLIMVRSHPPRILTDSPEVPRGRRVRGPHVEGASAAGETRLFVRTLETAESAAVEFLMAFPPEHVLTTARDSSLWACLRDEADHLSVATTSVITRLVDLLFIEAMRRWIAEGEAHGWMRAVLDPVVGAALHLFHAEPEHPWTLQEVADRVGTGKVALSRRFQLLVGEPPMTYLRQWRLTRAATLLEQERGSVAAVARRSGFTDPFEFSAAFSKKYGLPPSRYRDAGASAGSA